MAVTLIVNTGLIRAKAREAQLAALVEIGKVAVGNVRLKMQTGYYRPIYLTGALRSNVQYEVEAFEPNSVVIGNTGEYATNGVHYAKYVHFGTYKMPARPYLEAVYENMDQYQKITVRHYKRVFGIK